MLHGAGPCSDLPEAECCPGPVSPRQRAALAPPCAAEAWAAHREHCGAWPSRAEAAAWGGGHALPRLGGALSSTAPSTPQSSGRRAAEGDGAEPTAAAADAVDRALSGGGGCRLLRILLDGRVLGSVEVALDSSITLFDLRGMIAEDQIQGVPPEFCFLLNGGPVSEPQEKRWLAANCLPALDIAERNADGSWGLFGFFAYLFGSSGPAPASPDPASAAPAPWSPGPLPARPAPPEPPALLAAQRAALAAAARSAPRAQHADDVLSHSQLGCCQTFDLTEHDVDEDGCLAMPSATGGAAGSFGRSRGGQGPQATRDAEGSLASDGLLPSPEELGNPMQPRPDRSVEAQRKPLPSVPRAPRPRARSNSAGAVSRAMYARGDSRPGSASSKGSNDGRLSRCGSGIVRDESPQRFARVHALQRHDEGQEQSLPMGPPPRPFSAHSLNGDFRRGRSLSVDASARPPAAAPAGGRRRVLEREARGEEQKLEFFPRACDSRTGRPGGSGDHRRVNQLDREFAEPSDQAPRAPVRSGSTEGARGAAAARSSRAGTSWRTRPSGRRLRAGCPSRRPGTPTGPTTTAASCSAATRISPDIGFSAAQLCHAGA
ncbi:unnamed protein product [Prorocentrum cordatum]|uniref:Uncharacterized protein n=1 Tax=Prorocentrum cordatum TaxID=2364126 RepID=A0ABN9Q3B0_9DINO|nr:unnamed protein product [Polarella glacialis]